MNTKYIVTFLYSPSGIEGDVNNIISQIDGVKKVESNKHVRSIVDIEYDPQLVSSSTIVNQIKQQVSFLGKVIVVPGEFEMEALAAAGVRFLNGEEQLKEY